MALYDNKLWLLSHVHNSFISSDDSGVCELVLGSGDFKQELRIVANNQGLPSFTDNISDEEDEDVDGYRRSPDIRGGSNWTQASSPTHKQGSKLQAVKPPPVKSKTVLWKPGNLDSDELESLFPRKEKKSVATVPKVSMLSQQLENLTVNDNNPWLEYGKFDGAGNPDQKFVRAYSIYYPFTVGDLVNKPIQIFCRLDSKVSDLVGLACYKYTVEGREPRVLGAAENYSLFLCEEDGSVDWDFPALDSGEPLGKYGFNVLAVVESSKPEQSALCITLHMPDGTFSQLEIQRRDMTLAELMDKGFEKRKRFITLNFDLGYHIEAADKPGVALDPTTALNVNGGTEFYVVRNNSKRVSGPRDAPSAEICFLEAPLFQSFNVEIFTKVRTKVDIHLGISEEKVEIDPKHQSSSAKFWSKQRAVSYALDQVVSCDILDNRQKGDREVFRMVYLSDSGWGQRDFEADTKTAATVVGKLNYLLDLKQSSARKQRKEYLQNKEKKKGRQRTITN